MRSERAAGTVILAPSTEKKDHRFLAIECFEGIQVHGCFEVVQARGSGVGDGVPDGICDRDVAHSLRFCLRHTF